MKNKIVRICAAMLLAASMITGVAGTNTRVMAATTYEGKGGVYQFKQGEASIKICGNENQTLLGKTFRVYQLFDAENAMGNESIQYTFHPKYQAALQKIVGKKLSKTPSTVTEYEVIDYIQSLHTNVVEGANTLQKPEGAYSSFRYFIEELRNEIEEQDMEGIEIKIESEKEDHSVELTGLEYGYYLIDEITTVSGTHAAASMCMVSTSNPSASFQIKSDYPSIIKKIQEDDRREEIGQNGWNDIGDYAIGQTVPYQFQSVIPNINGYSSYYYAWHDVMDQALSLQKDSIKITIEQQEGENIPEKTYQLKTNEFELLENPGNGDTFQVVISDIKEIVDREFKNQNLSNENVYGQKVTLEYQATLNEKAVQIRTKPGFENDVRLEFSNDPDQNHSDSRGFTPWDTVVCFTYKMHVSKENNKGLLLAGAKFRLYKDEECTQEIYVKETEDGYIVMHEDLVERESVLNQAVEMMSDEDGGFTIYGLDSETYYLKETKAPQGYRVLKDPIELKIEATFPADRNSYLKGEAMQNQTLLSLKATAKVKTFLSGILEEEDQELQTNIVDGSLYLTVINHIGTKLPVTGSSMMLVLLVVGTGMMTVALRGKKKEK